MFWGGILKEGQPLKSQKLLETSEFAVLHLSAAISDKPNSKPTRVYCKNGKDDEVIIASFNDKVEQVNLDLYINCTQNVTLFSKGPSDVHLSGYFEPKGDDMDDELMYGQEEGDEELEDEEDDSEEEKKPVSSSTVAKIVESNLKQAKINSNKNAGKAPEDSDEDDDIEYDDEEGEDLDDLDLDAEESEESEEERPSPQKKAAPAKPQLVPDSDDEDDDEDLDDQLADDNSDEDDSEELDLEAILK